MASPDHSPPPGGCKFFFIRAFAMAHGLFCFILIPQWLQLVKNLSVIQKTRVLSLDREDPLEKGMTTYSSILTWRIPWTEEPSGLQYMGLQRVRHDWVIHTFFFFKLCIMPASSLSPGTQLGLHKPHTQSLGLKELVAGSSTCLQQPSWTS